MKKLVFLSFVSILSFNAFSQLKIGNNPTTINSNSILELESTNKGLLIPRVALQATNNAAPLSSFVAGMLVYNTATAGDVLPGFYVSNGSSWTKIDNQTSSTLYNSNGSIPASTTRAVTFGSGSNLNFDANTLYIDGDQNRVGIGTALPSTKLDVTGGQIRIDTDYTLTINRSDNFTHNSKSMSHYGIGWFGDSWDNSGGTAWLSGYAGLKFFSNGTARMYITRGGNVGIGNASPSEKLDVTGNIRFSGALMPNNLAGTSGQVLTSAGSGAVPTWTTLAAASTLYTVDGSIPASTTRAVSFGSASNLNFDSNTLYIDGDNSRIGIGTNSPTMVLNVKSTTADALKVENSSAATTTAGASTIAMINNNSTVGNYTSITSRTSANGYASAIEFINVSHTAPTGDIRFVLNNAGSYGERLRITAAGNLGIGKADPSEKLDVAGNVRFSGALLPNNSAGTSGQVLTSAGAGAVPTWTTLPTVTTYTGSTSVTLNGTSFEREALTGDVTASANSNALTIATDAVTSTKILDGTIATADVANSAVTYGKIQNISANNTLLGRATTGAGTVEEITLGTGLSLSGTTLSASSDLRLVNTTSHVTQDAGVGSNGSSAGGADNIMIGSGTGNSNSGTKNVFIGKEAGNANTTSTGSTFIGYQTGKSNTTGGANTYLGYQSGLSGITNSANTFIGYQSGNSNTGDNNNAFGYLALRQNTSGGGNAAFGTQSMMSNSTGFENTALGTYTLFNNTTGYLNVASGARSMMSNTTGNYNTANGYQSLTANTTGSSNTAFGSQSLYTNSTGNNNVSIGVQALQLATSSNNLAVGFGAGNNITTGAKNIVIGHDIDAPSATSDNQLNIGNIIFGNNVDGSATTISTGNIGIGVASPSQKLDVNGAVKFSGALMPNNSAGTSGQVLTSAGAGAVPTWTTLPTATTLYNGDGSLSGNRTVTQGSNTLTFTSSATNGFSVDGSTFSVDASNNRVGIGTTTPTSTLDVRGYGVFGTGTSGLAFGQGGYSDIHAFGTSNRLTLNYGVDLSTDINFNSNADVTIVTGGTGKLGVGSFPTEKLDVNGNVKFSGALMPNNTAGTAGQVLTSAGAGAVPTWTTPSALSTIYSADGTLSGNRTVTQGANTLAFTSTATNGFSVDGTTFSVDAANNRIGIGTSSPQRNFDILGTNARMAIIAGENESATIGLGTNNSNSITGAVKTAIIAEGINSWSRAKLHFALSDNASSNSSSESATVANARMTIQSNGNIGIGTTSPTQVLDVKGTILARFGGTSAQTTGNEQLLLGYAGTANYRHAIRTRHNDGNVTGNAIDFYTWSNADAVGGLPTLLNLSMNGGNIGIGTGTSTPSSRLEVAGGKIKIDGSQTLTIAPSDNFTYDSKSMSHYGIGWFNDSWNGGGSTAWLSGYGGVKLFGGGSLLASFHQYGTCSNTTGSWSAFSDARIKTVKSEFKDGLDVIKQINPVRFVYNENAPFKSKDVQIGIVAQDLEKVAPYMVTKNNDGEIQDLREVNSQAYVFLLINAVKEQQAQIEEMKKEIEQLKKDKK